MNINVTGVPMKQEFGKYYLGLDIGTDSVGWAVTNDKYEILDFKNKAMWGIHLFESGKTAETRRLLRCSRRRLQRRSQRIAILNELLDSEICQVDPLFYSRLRDSKYLVEDKEHKQPNSFFNDPNFKDRDLHKKFPTIFHLRSYLMTAKEKPDIRLVYLAIHHIIKYRGHFLFENISDGEIPEFSEVFEEFLKNLSIEYGVDFELSSEYSDIEALLMNNKIGAREKKKELYRLLSADDDVKKSFMDLLLGSPIKTDKLFPDAGSDSIKICFKDSNYDDKVDEIEDAIGTERMITVGLAKQIYDWSILSGLLKGCSSISMVMVKQYDQHQKDLKLLKNVTKSVFGKDKSKYNMIFKSATPGNYCSYVGVFKKKDIATGKKCTQAEFCAFLKKTFENASGSDKLDDIGKRIADGTFMPKQTNRSNSLIPNALHRNELKAILENISRFYPSFEKLDDEGYSLKDKIMSLCTFRVPYYVGPIGGRHESHWAIRKDEGRILPWKFDSQIDLERSSENFINRMTSTCKYLVGEKVLPDNSPLYCRFKLYDELNSTSINGERIKPEIKSRIVKDLFENPKSLKKVTVKNITEYLRSIISFGDGDSFTGIDVDVKSSLKSEYQLRNILKNKVKNHELCESIVYSITIFGEDSKILKKKLYKEHGDELTPSEIDAICKLRFNKWGNLSKKLLTDIYHKDRTTGVEMNIITAMEQTNLNFMELLSNKYSYLKQIDALNNEALGINNGKISYDLVEDLHVSPAVKRSIWRTLNVVGEIIKITGHKPEKVFIETTREKQESKRTVSRKNELLDIYKSSNVAEPELINSIEGTDDAKLRSKKLFAYYTQRGRCMYCGKKIDLNDIGTNETFDMDHIFPQSKVVDDSIRNNMVLSCRDCNQLKSDMYPLPPEWQKKMMPFWKELRVGKFISEKKYSRLIRQTQLTQEELNSFIARQIVETSQAVKAVADSLKATLGSDSDIVYVKGSNVSDFRQGRFVKCRSVNDYHHAKDAYLNIVVGNVYDVKFTKDYRKFVDSGEKYNLRRMFDFDVKRNGVVAWKAEETINTVTKYMARNNIHFTRYSYEKLDEMFNMNAVKKCEGTVPIKRGMDTVKYGGYKSLSTSYFAVIDNYYGDKITRTIEAVPIMVALSTPDNITIEKYFAEKNKADKTKVVLNKIKNNSVLEVDGMRLIIAGRSGDRLVVWCGKQLILPTNSYDYCKKIFKYIENLKDKGGMSADNFGLTADENIHLYDIFISKMKNEPYCGFKQYQTQEKSLNKGRDQFLSIDIGNQAIVLDQILHLFQCNSLTADLRLIGGVPRAGSFMMSDTLAHDKDVELIHQSVTGLFEKRVKLNKL